MKWKHILYEMNKEFTNECFTSHTIDDAILSHSSHISSGQFFFFFSLPLPLKQPAFYYYYYNIIRVSVPSFLSCMAVIWAHARTPFLVRSFQIIDSTVTHSSSPHRYDDSNTIAICEYRVDTYFMRWSLTPFLYYFPPRLQRSHSHLTTHTIWGDCYANLRNVQQLCFLVL